MTEASLTDIVAFLENACGAHISVCNLGGLSGAAEALDFPHLIHSAPFCVAAKSTARGLERCLRCKTRANCRAQAGKPFEGICAWGLYEFACPVMNDDQLLGVVYAGNYASSDRAALLRRTSACNKTGISPGRMAQLANTLPDWTTHAVSARTAVRILAELLVHRPHAEPKSDARLHPSVQTLLQYATHYYMQPLSLERLAHMAHMDAKYLGRLFRQQTGRPFHTQLNEIRLTRARELLLHSDESVLQIAMACGFPNISYFNRLFREAYRCTPTQLRSQNR